MNVPEVDSNVYLSDEYYMLNQAINFGCKLCMLMKTV